jgi:hypothetical protein
MPQLALSVPVLVSQPFVAFMSQLAKPVLQAPSTHALAAQLAAALAKVQARPHAEQLVALVRRSVSQPLAAIPSQLPKLALHVPTPHVPEAHVLTLTLVRRHTLPHMPQCDGSVMVFTHAPEQLVVPAPHVVVHDPEAHT